MREDDRHPSPEPRPRLPIPTWIGAWPRGLQPTSLCASRRGVEFTYRAPGDRWFRVVVSAAPQRPSGVEVRGIPGPDPDTVSRLARAVELRLQRSPLARGWLGKARDLVVMLGHLRVFGGEGSERDQAVDELLTCMAEVGSLDGEPTPEQLAKIETTLAAAREHLGESATIEIEIVLWLSVGAFRRALDLWGLHGASIEAREDPGALACSAIMRSFLGRVADAQASARALAARSRDAIDARHAGELLERTGVSALAAEQLRMAATDSGGDADAFQVHRRLATVATSAGLIELVSEAAAAMRSHAKGPEQLLAAAIMKREAGDFLDAEAILEQLQGEREAELLLMSLRLWRRSLEGAASLARTLLERDADEMVALRTLAAVELFEGRPEQGLELIDRALELDADDNEAKLWRAEILDRLERFQEARDQVVAVTLGDLPIWQVLRALIEEHLVPRSRIELDTWFIVDRNVRQVLGDEAPADIGASHEVVVEALTRTLDKFGGNRTERLTSPTPDGSLCWLGVKSPRRHAEKLQFEVTYRDVDEVIADLAVLAKTYPEVPFFRTYPAELLMWRGEYQHALGRFQEVWVATRTRWGYVGSGAAAYLLGDHDQALASWEEGKEYYVPIGGEATFCYRGELYRRRGEHDNSRADLDFSLNACPERLGALINLALLEHALGNEGPLREAVVGVEALCPAFAWEARCEAVIHAPVADLNVDELERWMSTLLDLMNANRSSTMYSIFDRDNVLRILSSDPPQLWCPYLRRSLVLFEDVLLTRLAVRHGL